MIFSPTYHEKVANYIQQLNLIAESAHLQACYFGIPPVKVQDDSICKTCRKRRYLHPKSPSKRHKTRTRPHQYRTGSYNLDDTGDSSSRDEMTMNSSRRSLTSHTHTRDRPKSVDISLMSAVLKTVIALNSGDSWNIEPNRTLRRKKSQLELNSTSQSERDASSLSFNSASPRYNASTPDRVASSRAFSRVDASYEASTSGYRSLDSCEKKGLPQHSTPLSNQYNAAVGSYCQSVGCKPTIPRQLSFSDAKLSKGALKNGEFQRESTDELMASAVGTYNQSIDCKPVIERQLIFSDSMLSNGALPNGECMHGNADLMTSIDSISTKKRDRESLSRSADSCPCDATSVHGEGLLYTSSFGIGDHGWNSDEFDDGYCKCDFCNHDIIFTPARADLVDAPHHNDDVDERFAFAHERLRRLHSLSGYDESFTVSERGKERKGPRNDGVVTSPLQLSWNLVCGDDDEYAPNVDTSVRNSSTQKALQRDIERHSSGVASVLDLCEVLLHDVDACSNDSEKSSIEKASESLDRRWRNICSLSMERKLGIEETQRLWKKFMDDYSSFTDWLRSAEQVVMYPHSSMVTHEVARAELKKYEGFQRRVHESLTQLELINKQYRKLARENRTDATDKLKGMIHEGNSRWDAIATRVTSILRRLKHTISRREDFETHRESLVVWLTETDLRLTNVEHLSQRENREKLLEVKQFHATLQDHIPQIIELHRKGQRMLQASEAEECVVIEEELVELQKYCRDVVRRLDKYHKKLLKAMKEPEPSEGLLEDSDLAQLPWMDSALPVATSGRVQNSHLAHATRNRKSRDSVGTHSGRATPESLEWDLYDISHSELETNNVADDDSIPEILPLEMDDDEVPLLHVSRDSQPSTPRDAVSFESTPPKKARVSEEDQKTRFESDLDSTLAWLEATEKVTDREMSLSGSKFEKSVEEVQREVEEIKDLEKCLEDRRAVVLAVKVSSSWFADAEAKQKVEKLNRDWESLQQKSADWTKSLQESLAHSQDFHKRLSEMSSWVDEQNSRRDDITKMLRKSAPSDLQEIKRNLKTLEVMKSDATEAISKMTTMGGLCLYLTPPGGPQNGNGVRALSTKVQCTKGRLKVLLDAVRSDLADMEHEMKAARRKMRRERSSDSDSSVSSSDSIRLKMLQRKVDASQLHSSGKANDTDKMTGDRETMAHSDFTTETHYDTHFLERLRQTSRITTTRAEKPSPILRGGVISSGEKKTDSFCCRVFYVALMFYIIFAAVAFLIWFFGAYCDDTAGCLRRNNYVYSFTPMLTYTNGPPPV